jgi:hypothetical protein
MRFSFAVFCHWLIVLVALPAIGTCQTARTESSNPWSNYRLTPEDCDNWYEAEVGFISLFRSQPASMPFVFTPSASVLLDMDELTGSGGKGFDGMLNVKRVIGGNKPVDFQMRFFESREMLFSRGILSTPAVIPVFYSGIPATPATDYRVTYESDLQSGEINLRTPVIQRLYGVAGIRYFELEEQFDIVDVAASGSGIQSGYFSGIDNDAIGGQIGLEGILFSGKRGRITGGIKWGLLSNSVRGIAMATDVSGNPLTTRLAETEAAQLIDLQLGGAFAIVDWLSLYGGYQGLIGSDFALAPTQSRESSIFNPTNPVTFESTQWHGYRLGVALAW